MRRRLSWLRRCRSKRRHDEEKAEIYIDRGIAYENKGEYDKAIADYTEAIRLDPKDAKAYCSRGWAYGKRRIRQGHCRLHGGHPAEPKMPRRITTVAVPTSRGRI